MGTQGFPGQPRTILREAAAGGPYPIGHYATSPGTSQSRRTSMLKGSFKQGDRTVPGHFVDGYQVEALTRENSIACICTTRGRQTALQRRAGVNTTAYVSTE